MNYDDFADAPAHSSDPAREPEGAARRRQLASEQLDRITKRLQTDFKAGNRVLSFREYLDLFATNPVRYGRSAPVYLRDMFRHYGVEEVARPWGTQRRFKLFDAPWDSGDAALRGVPRLLGQEQLQNEIYRVLANFSREGLANRLILMHGPNGSAKSTAAGCIMAALEDYSCTEEGALYRFHWVFPSRKTARGSIGFGGGKAAGELDSFAHLDDAEVDARLVIELRDHPLFLVPGELRRPLVEELWRSAGAEGRPSEWLYGGELSHKNKQIFEALLADYEGSLSEVLKHVQVERYFVSRRYRVGAVTLGPQMSVDANERQVTADRSLSSLPTSLQATTLFEAHGELVDASGGILEFSDLLKRPIDTFRYLQLSLETGEVPLVQQTIFTNVVMVGSANDIHMAAFREHPEYASFRGRLELVRVAYLRNTADEQAIYETYIVPQLRRHMAPHTTLLAAEFAVLTRMRRPDPGSYSKPLGEIVESLTAVEKMVLYADGTPPTRLSNEEKKLLRANVAAIFQEWDAELDYEGRVGISPREVRALLLDAAQSHEYKCVSPFAVLKGIEELCKRTSEFEWLKLKPLSGGYHDHESFREIVRTRLMDRIEADMRVASGLIDESQYVELFRRYITQVSSWVKGEKLRNLVTGRDEDPDAAMMREVEGLLGREGAPKEHRETLISMIAAWAIDNPGRAPPHAEIFPGYVELLQTSAFEKLRKPIGALLRNMVTLLRDDGKGLEREARREVDAMLESLRAHGYDEHSAGDAASALLRERYVDVV